MPPKTSMKQRVGATPDIIQGALYMTAAAFCFALMNVLVREANQTLDSIQIAFLRNFFALMFITPWLLKTGRAALATEHRRLHLWRAIVGTLAMFVWFKAVTIVPLAEAVALNFTLPLFAIAGAAVILREPVGIRRWGATAVGFLGMLVILRTGFQDVTWATMLPIVAAVFMAISVLFIKRLSATDSAPTIVLYMNLFMTVFSLPPALLVWQWPDLHALLSTMALGFLAMLAHLALARSYAKADASAVMPFDYMRLPFIAFFAYFLYGEVADAWTWLGAGIIAGSAFYIARREAMLARRAAVSPTAAHAARGR